MITYENALALIAKEAGPVQCENITTANVLGRILAQDITAGRSLPLFDNTAMDGFALRAADSLAAPVSLPVVGSVAAGDVPGGAAQTGAVEIMTGAPMPSWCDCVVPVENVEVERDKAGAPLNITIKEPVDRGKHIRRAGEDVKTGQVLLRAGKVVTPEVIAILTSLGLDSVKTAKRPTIALIGTGQEVVRDLSAPLKPGQIYDSNTPYLQAALMRAGFKAQVVDCSPDDTPGFLAALEAAGDAQIIISTGAVSMGRRDFVPEALAQLGARTVFHKVTIRPGKPILFARLPNDAYFFGLPGNPVSAAVGLAFFVQKLLDQLTGKSPLPVHSAQLTSNFQKKKSLTMFAKAHRTGPDVEILGGQQSFRIAPLLQANGWAVLPTEKETLCAGEAVQFVPFEGCW